MKDLGIAVAIAVAIISVGLTVTSVIHDLSDGKIDGTKYTNGCTSERR